MGAPDREVTTTQESVPRSAERAVVDKPPTRDQFEQWMVAKVLGIKSALGTIALEMQRVRERLDEQNCRLEQLVSEAKEGRKIAERAIAKADAAEERAKSTYRRMLKLLDKTEDDIDTDPDLRVG